MIGGQEWLIIIIGALLLFGPKKLPEMARSVGKAVAEYRRTAREFQREVEETSRVELEEREISPEVLKIAKNMGIETEGKSEKEILKAIESKSSK